MFNSSERTYKDTAGKPAMPVGEYSRLISSELRSVLPVLLYHLEMYLEVAFQVNFGALGIIINLVCLSLLLISAVGSLLARIQSVRV